MIQLLGYNFLLDGDSLNPYPTNVGEITSATISHAMYKGLYMTEDTVISEDDTTIPTDWDIYTRLLAHFNDSYFAGSIDYSYAEVKSVRIKRRKKGEFEWATIFERQITSPDDFYFTGTDYFAMNNEEYEYAWVPVDSQGAEGGYEFVQTVLSQFNGVFICDADVIYKFLMGVAYGSSQQAQQVGIYNPLGQKYPIYVSNGAINYQTGSLSAKLVGNYEDTHQFNRKEMVQQKNALLQWLTNRRSKIIKDSNSNIWLVFITGSPSISYDAQWGNGMMEVSLQYGELGEANNIRDMQNAGLWPIITQ